MTIPTAGKATLTRDPDRAVLAADCLRGAVTPGANASGASKHIEEPVVDQKHLNQEYI